MKLFQKIRQGDFLVYFLAAGLLAQSYLSVGLFLKVAPSSHFIIIDLGVAIAFAIGVDLIALTLATRGEKRHSWAFAAVSMLINVGDLYDPSVAIISPDFAMLLLVSIAIPSVTATYSHIAVALMQDFDLHAQIAELKQKLALQMQDKDLQSQLNSDLQSQINELQVQSASTSGASRALQIARDAAERDVQTLAARNQELAEQLQSLQADSKATIHKLQSEKDAIAMQFNELQGAMHEKTLQLQEFRDRPAIQSPTRAAIATNGNDQRKSQARAMKNKGLTNKDIAFQLDVNPSTVSRWLKSTS